MQFRWIIQLKCNSNRIGKLRTNWIKLQKLNLILLDYPTELQLQNPIPLDYPVVRIGSIQFRWIIQRNWLEFPLNVVSGIFKKLVLICLIWFFLYVINKGFVKCCHSESSETLSRFIILELLNCVSSSFCQAMCELTTFYFCKTLANILINFEMLTINF